MIFLRKKIYFASNVIGEASKAIGHMPFTLFWPIFPFAFILGTIALWLFVDLNLRSIATAEGVYLNHTTLEPKSEFSRKTLDWVFDDANKCDPLATYTEGQFCFYVKHVVTNYTPWLQIYNFAVCLWLINYIIAVDQLTLAGTFAKFYFSQRQLRRRGGSSSCYFCGVCLVFGTCASAIIFHTGSLAFGSLLITLLALLRAILLKIERRLKMADNEIAKFFIRCLCCCFWCLDKFLRFLNKNAYIMMAIYGHGFCRSAKDVFSLIVRNVIRVFVVEKITDFVLFLGKLAVSAAVSFFAYAYLSGVISDRLDIVPDPTIHLNYIIVPILVS
nr:solute carrier family 44 [Hymenolepis microstoma]